MIDLLYGVFFWSLVLESVIFLFLNLPTPKGFKSTIINFLSTNKIVGYLIYAHLVFCLIALFFYLDLTQSQKFFLTEKDRLKLDVERHLGSELRIGFLSYTVLKIQRNKYITFMLLYVSIALNIFVHLLRHIYKQRQELQKIGYLSKPVRKDSDKLHPHTVSELKGHSQKKQN